MVRRRAPDPADRLDQVGAGQRAGRPVVDGVAAVALQRLLCQQPVPGAAAVLQVAGPGGGAAGPDGAAAAAGGHQKLIPVFTSVELSKLERACQGRSFAQRWDAAIIAVFGATGIRLSELAGSVTTRWMRSVATWTCGSGRTPSRQGRQAAHRQDQLPVRPDPGPVPPCPLPARPGLAAAAVAGGQ
jgi:hypothetical protein